ncbi:MAG: hypothetical protein ACJ76J_18695 [Thermoanaerobaculia bacterium]
MSRVPDYMKRVVGWDRTTTQVGERKAEISHLDAHRLQLEGISQRYKDLNTQYKALSATRMELSQQMQQLFRQGEAVVNFLRTGVRTHYGLNSEQLIAFDLVPTSRRAKPVRKAKQPVVPVPVPEPAK